MTRSDQDRATRARLIRAIEDRRRRYPHGQIADLYWQVRQVTTRILRRELKEAKNHVS